MPQTTRTFVAIVVPEDRAAKIGRLQNAIAQEAPGGRWVDPKIMHATLAFLGDVIDTDLDLVCRTVGEAAAPFEPFELSLEGLGAFPGPNRPRAVWLGLKGPGTDTLAKLHKSITKALSGVGYAPSGEDRFTPHVTLGRFKSKPGPPVNLSALMPQYRGWSAGTFTVAEVVTFASTTSSRGPVYAPLSRASLQGRTPASQA